jgi:hypothetical protein
VVETGPVLSGDGHCCHGREGVATGVTENDEVHGRAGRPVMTGGGGPWGPSKYSRIPWTAETRSLRTPLISSGV